MFNAQSNNVWHLPATGKQAKHPTQTVFELASSFKLEDLHFKYDSTTGLKAIVAIHNTQRGPALGGTRCMSYATENEAIVDAIQLARDMSYKSAFAKLPYGGGKAVLMRPHHLQNSAAYFESYGEFLNTLNGRFITAVDVGTRIEDMDMIARKSNFVMCTSTGNGDPSHDTAKGVLYGIKAATKMRLKRKDLEGIRVAIQGVGKVGFYLAKLLHQEGAKLIISDLNLKAAQHCAQCFAAELVSPEQIYSVDCDVFSPCALGGSLNNITVNLLNAGIICGSANNQLASISIADILQKKQIFLAPDFVVNAGGLIHVVIESKEEVQSKISKIYDAVFDIFQRSEESNQPSYRIARKIAEQILLYPQSEPDHSIYIRSLK